jgi:hypothetical protein
MVNSNCIVVEEPVYMKVTKYKKIDLTDPKPNSWYEKKLLGWTAPISNLLGRRLAEKRHRIDENGKWVKVRKI